MYFNYLKTLLFTVFFSIIFSGCAQKPEVDGKIYILDTCREELIKKEDFHQEEKIDYILIDKQKRKMYVYKGGKIDEEYSISLGKNPIGTKEKQGDFKTPEGSYWIRKKICSPKYYRSLSISYPSHEDAKKAKAKGLNPGGDITIHAQPTWNADGNGDDYTLTHNWTNGCIAVTNSAMKKLWYCVDEGVPVIIKGQS